MAGSLGSASFELVADNTQLTAAFVQAKATAQNATKAISDAAKAQAAVLNATSEQQKQALSKVAVAQTQAAQGFSQMATQANQRYQAMAQSATQAAGQVTQANIKMSQGNQQAGNSFLTLTRAGVAFVVAAAGVKLGAETVHDAMEKVTETTLKAEQAQRALNAAYGAAAPIQKQYADSLADQFKRTNTEVERGVAQMSVLQRQYGLTGAETQKLTKLGLDLNAAYGGDLQETFRSVEAAIRGEAEALEKYGIALQQNAIENSNLLTDAQKRNFSSMDAVSQARLRYRIILEAGASVEGAAKARADSNQGAFDRLNRATDELAKTIGKTLVPAQAEAAGWFAKEAEAANASIIKYDAVKKAIRELREEGKGFFTGNDFFDFNSIIGLGINRNAIQEQINKDATRDAEYAAINRRIAEQRQAELDAKARADSDAADETERRKRQGEAIARDLQQAHDARIKDLDDQKTALEAKEEAEIRALDASKDRRVKEINEAAQASKDASDAEIARLQVRLETEKRLAQDAHDDEIKRIEVVADAVKKSTDEAIRNAEHKRDAAKKASEDERDSAIERLDAEKRARDDRRVQEDRARDDANQEIERAEDHRHDQEMRDLDDEAAADRKKSDKRIRNLDRAADREEERHRKAVRNIEDEAQRQLDAIDAQLRALDDADRQAQNADRTSDLQGKVGEAQQALTRARGTGTPAEIAAARAKLTAAIKIGDPEAEKKARDELVAIAGQGTVAIREAEEKLAEAEKNLRDEGTKQSRDAERQRLKDAQDAIRQKADDEKRQEEDRDRKRKARIDKDKQSERDRMADLLDKLAKSKRAEDDLHDHNVEQSKDAAEQRQRDLEDVRRKEEEDDQDARRRVQRRYEDEREQIRLTYDDDQVGQIPALRRAQDAAQESYERQKDAAHESLQQQQRQIDDTYNNQETGLIPLVRKAAEENARKFNQMAADVVASHAAQKQAIQDTYTNKERTGLIDRLEDLKDKTDAELKLTLQKWEDYKKGLVGDEGVNKKTWDEATKQAQEFFNFLKSQNGLTVRVNVEQRSSGGGSNRNQGGNENDAPGGGGGSYPNPPSVPGTTPAPPEGSSGEVDVSGSRFAVGLGYAAPYNGSFAPGPGWEGGAAWAGGPSHHKGIDLRIKGADNGGLGMPIGAFTSGNIKSTFTAYDPSKANSTQAGGKYVVIENGDKTFWYMHLNSVAKSSGHVNRGDVIGTLGETGTEKYPHLHFEVRNGFNNGPMSLRELRQNGVDPRPYMRDSGHLFTHPTLTYTPANREWNMIAERRPELLVGGAQTAAMTRGSSSSGAIDTDGLVRLMARAVAASRPIVLQGTSEELARKVRQEQRNEARHDDLLRGLAGRVR